MKCTKCNQPKGTISIPYQMEGDKFLLRLCDTCSIRLIKILIDLINDRDVRGILKNYAIRVKSK